LFAEVEGLASGADDDITDVLPQVHQLIAAIDYAIGLTRAPLFEPTESNAYRLADGSVTRTDVSGIQPPLCRLMDVNRQGH
jgi:hypothetical protein